MDDAQLVAATLRGNINAFEELVRAYQRMVMASACQIIRNTEDAEDLAQETFLEAYRDLAKLREPGSFRAWLFSILRHNCYEYLQRRRPEELPLEDVAETLAAPTPFSGELPLAECLEQLPLQQREILLARYMYGMSYREIAQSLQITELTARVRCLRARGQLRKLIEKNEEEERALRQAMAGLTVGVSTAFTTRLLHAVKALPSAPASSPAPTPFHLTAHWSGQALANLTTWKVAAVLSTLAVLGGGAMLLRNHHRSPAPLSRMMTASVTPAVHSGAAGSRTAPLASPPSNAVPVQLPTPAKSPEMRIRIPAPLHTGADAREIPAPFVSQPPTGDLSVLTAHSHAPRMSMLTAAKSAPIAEIRDERALLMDWFSEPVSGGEEMFFPVFLPFTYRAQGVAEDPNQQLSFPTLLNYKFGFAPDFYSVRSPAFVYRKDPRALKLGVTDAKMIAEYIRRWSATVAIGGSLIATANGYSGEMLVFAKNGAPLLRKRYDTPVPYFTLMGRMVEDWLAYRRQSCSPALQAELERPMTAKMETVNWYGESFQKPWHSKDEWAVYERILAADPDFGEVRYWYALQKVWTDKYSQDTASETARAFCSHAIPEAMSQFWPHWISDTAVRAQADTALARALALQPEHNELLCTSHFAYGTNDKSPAEMESLLPYARKYPNSWMLLHNLADYYCTQLQFAKGLPLVLRAAHAGFPRGNSGMWDEYMLAAGIYWRAGQGARAVYCLKRAQQESTDSEEKLTAATAIIDVQRDFLAGAEAAKTARRVYAHLDQFSGIQHKEVTDRFLACCQLAAEESGQAGVRPKEADALPEKYAALCTQRAALAHAQPAADHRVALPLDDAVAAQSQRLYYNPFSAQYIILHPAREAAILHADAALRSGRPDAACDARHAWCYSPLVPRSALLLEQARLKAEPRSLLRYAEVAQWLAAEEPYWRGLKQRALAAGAREDSDAEIASLIAEWSDKAQTAPFEPRQSAAFWDDAPPFLPEYLLLKALAQRNPARIRAAAALFAEYFQATALFPDAYQVHLHLFYDKISRLLPGDIAAQLAQQLRGR